MPNPLHALPLADLRRRTSAKWRLYPQDVLPLWVAEMDVPLAAPVARVLADTVALGDTGYAMGGEYVEALVEFAARRWDWRIEPAHAAVVPDVMRGIVEVLRLVTAPGDTVVVNPPVYPPFYLFVAHMDRQVAEAPLTADGRLDPVTLDAAFARATAGGRGAAYLLCNPHNPTGAVHTPQELAAVADLAGRYRVRVVSDEIHAPLVFGAARYVPYLTVPGGADAFALLSASKAWNLAGLKAAVAVAGPGAAGDLARMPEEVSHGPSHLGVRTHSVALREGGPWLDEVLAGLDENRRLLADLLAEHLPEVRYRPPEATYLAWLDCRALVPDGADPAELFLERGRVALTGATGFGTGAAGFARLNFATSPEILAEAVRRMASAVSPPWHRR